MPPTSITAQRGMALVISLVFMLMLAIIGASALRGTLMQERMAGNTRDTNTAFQAAEAALREAEQWLQGANVGPFDGSGGRYRECAPGNTTTACRPPDWAERSSTGWATVTDAIAGVSAPPQYYLEKLPPIPDPQAPLDADRAVPMLELYRVTARGFGVSDSAVVVLQTVYRRD